MPSTGPQETPTDLSFEARTPVPEGDTHLGWPRPISGRVGPYELLEEIAQGGMGIVYKARDTRVRRTVALKTMRADALRQPGAVQRFQREMEAAAQLSHPNIVTVFEVGNHEGQPYYTMAYLAGGTLGGQRERLLGEPRTVATLMEKIARAVEHAHERNIFHRDLKPGNVLIDERGEPQIGDFGLAKFRGGDLDLTQTGAVLGTIPYMSPEQAAGRGKDAGPSADVWALGVMLYELLTGQRPFTGADTDGVRRKILAEDPPRPRTLRPGLDRDLETVLSRCLDKSPGRRYPSAGTLAEDLQRYLRGEPIRPISRPARLLRTVRRHAWATALLAAGSLAVAALLFYRHYTDPDRPLEEYRRQWAAGEPLTLVTANGRCSWRRWVSQPGQLREPPQSDRFVMKSMDDGCFLELLPAPPPAGYRFRARVRHEDNGGETGGVGIYFGRSQYVQGNQSGQAFCAFVFNDLSAWNSRVELEVGHQVNAHSTTACPVRKNLSAVTVAGWGVSTVGLTGISAGHGPLLAATACFPNRTAMRYHTVPLWRDLVVEITPENLRVFWMGEELGQISRARLVDYYQGLATRSPAGTDGQFLDDQSFFRPHFGPQSGLGFYVRRGAAAFQDVKIEHLD